MKPYCLISLVMLLGCSGSVTTDTGRADGPDNPLTGGSGGSSIVPPPTGGSGGATTGGSGGSANGGSTTGGSGGSTTGGAGGAGTGGSGGSVVTPPTGGSGGSAGHPPSEPVTLIQGYVWGLALDDDSVYTGFDHALVKVSKTGGPPVVLVQCDSMMNDITYHEGWLYFTATFEGETMSLRRVPAHGGSQETLLPGYMRSLIRGDTLYAFPVMTASSVIHVFDLQDMHQTMTIEVPDGYSIVSTAVDAEALYTIVRSNTPVQSKVLRFDEAGNMTILADDEPYPVAIDARDGKIAWVNSDPGGNWSIVTAPPQTQVATGLDAMLYGVSIQGESVYWTIPTDWTGYYSGAVMVSEIGGPEVLVSGEANPSMIVSDEAGVYWVSDFGLRMLAR